MTAMAFSGVAAANLGSGATTIDSIFHTNVANAAEDLTGDRLDELTDLLQDVQLLVCLLYTSPSPRDVEESRMPSSA